MSRKSFHTFDEVFPKNKTNQPPFSNPTSSGFPPPNSPDSTQIEDWEFNTDISSSASTSFPNQNFGNAAVPSPESTQQLQQKWGNPVYESKQDAIDAITRAIIALCTFFIPFLSIPIALIALSDVSESNKYAAQPSNIAKVAKVLAIIAIVLSILMVPLMIIGIFS